MEELRKQAEATAAEEAVKELKEKLAEAEAKAIAAINDKAEAEARAAGMERQAKMGDPDVAKFQAMAEQIQQFYNTMNGYRLKVAAKDPETGRKLELFQRALLERWCAAIEGA
jgi:phage shock protein A